MVTNIEWGQIYKLTNGLKVIPVAWESIEDMKTKSKLSVKTPSGKYLSVYMNNLID